VTSPIRDFTAAVAASIGVGCAADEAASALQAIDRCQRAPLAYVAARVGCVPQARCRGVVVTLAGGLRALCFPTSDRAFAEAVHQLLADDGIRLPRQLEDGLRAAYPDVHVHVREITAEPGTTWYVYRDADFARWDLGGRTT